MSPSPAAPWLLCWQGLLATEQTSRLRKLLPQIAGGMLCALLLVLPITTRTGLGLLIAACGLLWLVWGLATPPVQRPLGAINGWLLVYLAIAVVATGLSPVPAAAAKGLLKLLSYLGVYALMRRLLEGAPQWWNRLLAALLLGQLITAVIGLRQLYAPIEDLALWADPNSVADGTRRIYSTLGNPNLLAGYLVPILPLAVIGLLRWQGLWPKLLALSSLGCGLAAALLSYSRGGWIGLLLALGSLGLLLLLRQSRRLGPLWGKLLPPLVITAVVVALVLAAIKVEPLRIRLTSMLAGRGDSSNNFRINVWLAALEMIQARPWIGIGPGNSAFNLIYPLYQQPGYTALSAYSVPLELAVETGIPGLLAATGLLFSALRAGAAAAAAGPGVELAGPWRCRGRDRPGRAWRGGHHLFPPRGADQWLVCPGHLGGSSPTAMTVISPTGGLLAGFDAGQTHTRCRLSQRDGRVVAEGEGSGVSHLGSEQGPERFGRALQSSLEAARRQGGAALEPLAAAAIGASGIEQDSPTQHLGTDLARQALGLEAVLVTGDERTALAGAFAPGQAGISLISGTGAIALGQNEQGRQHRCAGWGWLVDGVGSAMDIGRDGLAISLRMADGRLPETGFESSALASPGRAAGP